MGKAEIQMIPLAIRTMEEAGKDADASAAQHLLLEKARRLAEETVRRHKADLALFAQFLAEARIQTGDFLQDVEAWRGLTWGIVQGFVEWQLQQGYALGSINVRLSTVKSYAARAMQAGVISAEVYARIAQVKGYRRAEARHLDEQRTVRRRGWKKAKPIFPTLEQVTRLKHQPGTTPQGRRDAVLMCLFLDHGLRCGELAALRVDQFDLAAPTVRFDRPKVDKEGQTHRLTPDTLAALTAYFKEDHPTGPLLQGSRKGGQLTGGMSTRAITKRVNALGKRIGLEGLSAHDLRHEWTKRGVQAHSDLRSLMDAGGWTSAERVLLYAESGRIVNEGVKLASVEVMDEPPPGAKRRGA